MFDDLMDQITEHQKTDGAVERSEFDPAQDRTGWPDDVTTGDRSTVERFVYGKTPERHRFKTANGEKGIVFHDSRGRASSCVITEMDGEELARLARTYGKKLKGDNGDEPGTRFKPSKKTGYDVPDLAEEREELTEASEIEFKRLPVDRQVLAKGIASAVKGKISGAWDGIHGFVVSIDVDQMGGIRLKPSVFKAFDNKFVRWVEFHKDHLSIGLTRLQGGGR